MMFLVLLMILLLATWHNHIQKVLTCGKQQLRELATYIDVVTFLVFMINLIKSSSGAVPTHLHHRDALQRRVKHMSSSIYIPTSKQP